MLSETKFLVKNQTQKHELTDNRIAIIKNVNFGDINNDALF